MTLYVVRLNQTERKIIHSSPCIDCYHKLSKLGLKRVVYSTNIGYESVKMKDYVPTRVTEGDMYYHSLM